MNNFLKESRKLIGSKLLVQNNLCLVMGNESCDLDSVVSAISLAYHYQNVAPKNTLLDKQIQYFIPIMSIPRFQLPLKTEVVYYLKRNNINLENLICLEEIDLNESKLILVDHHVTHYNNPVIAVIDHHTFDSSSNLPTNCYKNINLVGSCATLIAEIILNDKMLADIKNETYTDVMKLLYGAIILDTVNFSKDADKVRPLDLKIAGLIESRLNFTEDDKLSLFGDLVMARTNISNLDSLQILYKDLKIIKNYNNKCIAIPGFPILVKHFIQKTNVNDNLLKFANMKNCNVIVLMGMSITKGLVERDLGIININDQILYKKIIEALTSAKELQLIKYDYEIYNGSFFKQVNIKASRKQVLPMIKHILDTY